MKVTLIYRSAALKRFSIEKVFDTLMPVILKQIPIKKICLPRIGGSPTAIVKNSVFATKIKGIRHITGDTHYVGIIGGGRTVLTIHDIGSVQSSGFFKRFYLRLFWFWLPCFFVKRITVISEFTKKELTRIVPFAKDKISVIPNPVDTAFTFHSKVFHTNDPIILCIGTKTNKNLERTIEAVHNIKCTLHIVGALNNIQTSLLKEYSIKYSNSVSITDEEMRQAYVDCDILCFPSTYEGFGMPIIEAQAIGRPVITSNLGAMTEVAQASACLVDPFSVESIREGILKVINGETFRQQLIQRGKENTKRFNVEVIAQKYMDIYKEIQDK